MSKLKDLTGEKFGRLTVLKRYGSNKKRSSYVDVRMRMWKY